MQKPMTMGELRARLSDMNDIPHDTPVFVTTDADEGSITEGLGDLSFQTESPRAPRGVWLPRVCIGGCGYAGHMEWWREGSEDKP